MDLDLSSNKKNTRQRERKGMLVPGTKHLASLEESKVVWLAKNIGM